MTGLNAKERGPGSFQDLFRKCYEGIEREMKGPPDFDRLRGDVVILRGQHRALLRRSAQFIAAWEKDQGARRLFISEAPSISKEDVEKVMKEQSEELLHVTLLVQEDLK